jgi:hypothetical protein
MRCAGLIGAERGHEAPRTTTPDRATSTFAIVIDGYGGGSSPAGRATIRASAIPLEVLEMVLELPTPLTERPSIVRMPDRTL